jgi:hypothetical protein
MLSCPDAMAPSDEELLSLSYEESTLSEQEQAHFARCSLCQERLAAYTRMHARLLAKLHRRLCPSAVRLNYYCLDIVPEEERVSIASHLLDCPACSAEVAQIRQTLKNFDPFPAAESSLRSAIRRIFATLVVQQALPVTRGASSQQAGWPRQYQAETLDLSLHLSRQASGEIMLLGILTSSDPGETADSFEGIIVELHTAPGPLQGGEQARPLLTSQVDDIGNLLLEPVPAGEYVMILRLPEREIVIEGLTIEHG